MIDAFNKRGKISLSLCRRILSKAKKKDEEESGRGRGKKKFAANGVSLMNAFFVPGKQRGPGPILPRSSAP